MSLPFAAFVADVVRSSQPLVQLDVRNTFFSWGPEQYYHTYPLKLRALLALQPGLFTVRT